MNTNVPEPIDPLDMPKATAQSELERRVSEFVRCALVGQPSEATLHQLERLIEVVTDSTVKGHLKSMARQVRNPNPTLTRFARRSAPGGVA